MTTPTQTNTIIATNLRRTFEGEILNAFKAGRGRILDKPISLDTSEGTWRIVKITQANWDGPSKLVAKIEVIPPVERLQGNKMAHLELNLTSKERNAKLSITRPR